MSDVGSKEIYETVYRLMPTKGEQVIHSGALVYQVCNELGLSSPDELGFFDSGKPKASSFVNNALKKMVGEGLAHKVGRGKYRYGAQPQAPQPQAPQPVAPQPVAVAPQPVPQPVAVAPQPVPQPVVTQPQPVAVAQPQPKPQNKVVGMVELHHPQEPSNEQPLGVSLDNPHVEFVQEVSQPLEGSDTWYDPRCESTLAFLASVTPCWSKFKSSDEACMICPLASQCENAKLELKRLKAEEREREREREEALQAVGVTSLPEIDPNADLSNAHKDICQCPTICVVSGEELPEGSEFVYVPNWGVLAPKVADALGISV